jgi:hypothetical protein
MLAGGWDLLRRLPGFGFVRHPLTWTFVVQLPLAWWVAVGVEAAVAGRAAPAARAGAQGRAGPDRARAVLALCGVAWGTLCLLRWLAPGSVPSHPHPLIPSPELAAGAAGELSAAGALGLAAAAALLVAAAVRAGPLRTRAVALAVVAAAAGQLAAFPFGVAQDAFDHPDQALRTRNLALAPDATRGRVLSLPDVVFGFAARDGIENVLGVEASLAPPRAAALEARLGLDLHGGSLDWQRLARARGLLDALDVSAVLAPRRIQRQLLAAGLEPTAAGDPHQAVLANPGRPGRAWVVYGARRVPNPEAALDRLLAPRFDPARQVVVESAPRGRYPASSPHPATPASVRYPSASVAEIEVTLPRPGILVLADACQPGWRARVDGAAAEWFCANYLVRGLELPAGAHRVEYRYEPSSVRLGLALSGATSFALLAAAAWQLRRRGA